MGIQIVGFEELVEILQILITDENFLADNACYSKRVFLLGPSHHKYLPGCALSNFDHYSTPLGSLTLDKDTISSLRATQRFEQMSATTDTDEHSLEMHLPYIHLMLEKQFGKDNMPPLVPILVGSTNAQKEKEYGNLLAPYLADPQNCFVVSSDFCHWGLRFQYTFYMPDAASEPSNGYFLSSKSKSPSAPTIAGSIARIDRMAMAAIESGSHDAFLQNLQQTGNTVCGRHPIGVIMAALETLREKGTIAQDAGFFKFLRYERSSDCERVKDSSVSYVSGYAAV